MKYKLTVSSHRVTVEAKNLNSAVHKASKQLIKEGKIEQKPRFSDSQGEWVGVTINNEIHYSDVSDPIEFNASDFRIREEKESNPDNDWVRNSDSAGLAYPTVVVTPRQKMPSQPASPVSISPLKDRKKLLKRKQAKNNGKSN